MTRTLVAGPLDKTFDVLAASSAKEAEEVLLAALESANLIIAMPAALALIGRQGVHGQQEILTRFPRLSTAIQQALRLRADRFDGLLRQLLLHPAAEQSFAGLNAVRWLQAVEQIPRLAELLSRKDFPAHNAVAACLSDLVLLLEEEVRTISVAESIRAAVTVRRDRALSHLEQALRNDDALLVKEPLIESILILGPSSHPAVKFVLWQAAADCRERAGQLLLTSRHPKIMRHALESLRQPYPHPKAFEAVRSRTDVEFLCELFRFCSGKASSTLERNLKQIEHLKWLEGETVPWDMIPPTLQPAMLSLVFSTKVATEFKAKTQDWLLRNGGPAGRMAAAEKAALLSENVLQDVLVDSLNAEDEHVQAWAVTQLRHHAVPSAFVLLLDRLDSPLAEVRDAARQELSDFNLERVLGMLDGLEPGTALRAGELVRKVDPDAEAKLERDLLGPIRPRRLKAAQAVVKLGFQDSLLKPLLSLSDDSDVMLRRTIAQLLESIPEPEVLPVLEKLTADSHPQVRAAAIQALAAWQRHTAEQLDPLLTESIV